MSTTYWFKPGFIELSIKSALRYFREIQQLETCNPCALVGVDCDGEPYMSFFPDFPGGAEAAVAEMTERQLATERYRKSRERQERLARKGAASE